MNGFRYVASQVVVGVVALHTSATLLPRSREAVNAGFRTPFLAATIACRNSFAERLY